MLVTSELDGRYFEWLCDLVCSNKNKEMSLLDLLFRKEFVWFVANDDNRAEDGKELRKEFLNDQNIRADSYFMEIGCSMLELLIGLSRRLAFEVDESESREWFWLLMKNAGLKGYANGRAIPVERVQDVLDRLIWRTYSADGIGGLFPLNNNHGQDQREIELWYQMSAYLLAIGAY